MIQMATNAITPMIAPIISCTISVEGIGYSFNRFVPTCATGSALIVLPWRWTWSDRVNPWSMASLNWNRIPSNHGSRYPDYQIVRYRMCSIFTDKLTHQSDFPCWQPKSNVGQSVCNFDNCQQVSHALQISRIMPSEEPAFLLSPDEFNHVILPMWVIRECIEPTLQCILNIGKHIPALASVAWWTRWPFNGSKPTADVASWCWDWIAMAWHFGRRRQTANAIVQLFSG